MNRNSAFKKPTGMKLGRRIGYFFISLILISGSIVLLIPLIWMLSTSLKSNLDAMAYPIIWIPEKLLWQNYLELFKYVPFERFIFNSAYISVLGVIGTVISSSIVAFGFARLRGFGQNFLFIVLISTMMLPEQVTMIPQFLFFRWIGTYDTSIPLWIMNWFAIPFFVFLLRQFMKSIHTELDDAARIDGCSTFNIYLKIMVPMIKPAMVTVAVLTFFSQWNDFLRPLIYLRSMDNLTLAIALNMFRTEYTMFWNLTMAAAVISVIPCIIIFFLAQKVLIQGFVVTGLK